MKERPSSSNFFFDRFTIFIYTVTMPNISIAKIFSVVIVSLFIVGSFTLLPKKTKNVNTHTVAITSTLNKFCACYLLTNSKIVDASTGESRQRIPETPKQFPNFLQFLSPSKTQEAMITVDRKEAYLLKYPELTIRRMYVAPDSRRIGQVVWSADGRTALFEIVDPHTTIANSSEGVVTSIVAVMLVTNEVRTVINLAATMPGVKSIFTLVWVSDDLKHVVFVMGDISNATWSRWDNGRITEIRKNISGAIYMKVAVIKDQGGKNLATLLWLDGQGLHGYDLSTEKTTTYAISTWSDSPISPPSPDGTSVVYLRRVNHDEAGQFVRLDLRDKTELLLANDVWKDSLDLGQSVWSPNGTRLLVSYSQPAPGMSFVETTKLSALQSVIHSGIDLMQDPIRAAVAK